MSGPKKKGPKWSSAVALTVPPWAAGGFDRFHKRKSARVKDLEKKVDALTEAEVDKLIAAGFTLEQIQKGEAFLNETSNT